MSLSLTVIIVIITAAVSILAFNDEKWFAKFQLNPYQVTKRKEWYRVVTHGFLHADWVHLAVNMLVLYSFGRGIEQIFHYYTGIFNAPNLIFIFLYLSAIIISSLTTVKKYKDDPGYNSVGASGAVSAFVFAYIFFDPWQKLYLFAVLPIPGIVFGVLYLIYSQYMSKKNLDNVNHDAHFIGAVYGFLFPMIFKPSLISSFLHELTSFNF